MGFDPLGSTTAQKTNTGSRLAATLDQKLADTEQSLFDVAHWYLKAWLATRGITESDQSDNEIAASYLGGEEFKSEAEVDPRKCECARPDPNVCECWETLQAARAALSRVPEPVPDYDNSDDSKPTHEEVERALSAMAREVLRSRGAEVIPQRIDLWSAMLLLAPLGNDLAQDTLGPALRARLPSLDETLFQDRRHITLLYAAFAVHPDHFRGDHEYHGKVIQR
jgi:hypothetical protein